MQVIKCQNCGQIVAIPGEKVARQCDNCSEDWWGYDSLDSMSAYYQRVYQESADNLDISQNGRSGTAENSIWSDILVEAETPEEKINLEKKEEKAAIAAQENIIAYLKVFSLTEENDSAVYPLKSGKNYIGRPSKTIQPDIALEGDEHLSRSQALIEVRKDLNDNWEYILTDGIGNLNGKASMNGTFLVEVQHDPNASVDNVSFQLKRIGPSTIIKLSEGDLIQFGQTKLTFEIA